ncbi:BamA/TamA family outer membrane protein [Ramlibacter sp. G-1-2-2]|uniref:BamA/TamA family outer membrane protein n=1 Tax=Ramlibacter agri TaxID=2728837 RepID=A0A848H8M7_9BURK|nr:BamA/TamA family outer membrane protein [Ramlibacter agri]NML44893.1 BamA/TamA family outer membrane protein [Ramlibacter agri]
MIRPFLAALLLALCVLAAPLARAQAERQEMPASPAFDLVVQAPDPLRQLLERHLELQRFREVSDLDDAEITRLIVLAEKDARELLATQGFFAPQVRITREDAKPRLRLVVAVDPGPATTVSNVNIGFEGDIATSTDADALAQRGAIVGGWGLAVGQPFTQARWDGAKSAALRQLVARRYPAGRISYSLADVDAASHEAALGLKLDSGPVFHLGTMQVTGVERYDPVLVPRLARLPVGSIYDQDRIVEAQLRLTGSGYYDSAFIFVDPSGDPEAAPVQVTVREAPLQKVVLGVGFTTDSGPRASIEHTANRVPGIGWRAVTKLQAEKKNPFAQTEWTGLPDEEGWRWSSLLRAERLDDGRVITYSDRIRGGRFQTSDHIDRNVYLQYENARVANPNNLALTSAEVGAGSAISANYVWTGRYFNSRTSPTSGYGLGFELGGGLTLSGDNQPFQRTVARALWFKPLPVGRLQLRGEVGAVFASGSAQIPATQLFRTGGDQSVRGYKYLDIGVPLADGVIGPGRLETITSVEWQRPIRWKEEATAFEHLLFLDMGAVADQVSELKPHWGVGTGVRWRSPVGPMDAAIAYGLQVHRLRFHLVVGFVF